MLRDATDDDRDLVLLWRNHPDVRRASLTTRVIGGAEHRAWWAAARADPARRVLIHEHDGEPGGVVVFADLDAVQRCGVWSYYLDVAGLAARNALLPAWLALERDAVDYAFDDLDLDRLGGETLAWNVQVLALHRRFGFREIRRRQRTVDGTPQEVIWTERGRT